MVRVGLAHLGALASFTAASAVTDAPTTTAAPTLQPTPSTNALDYKYDCTTISYRFGSSAKTIDTLTIDDCKVGCANFSKANPSDRCVQWSYDLQKRKCYLAKDRSKPVYDRLVISSRASGADGCTCPAKTLTTAFAPANSSVSQGLFGGTGEVFAQPWGLECWPKDSGYNLYNCGPPAVVRSTEKDNWPGACLGLERVTGVKSRDACEQKCKASVLCSTWQWVDKKDQTGAGPGCYQGMGYDCGKNRGWEKADAGRFQWGEIRVIANVTSKQVVGLTKIFGLDAYNQTDAVQNCKEVCYSSLLCNVWQYYSKAGTAASSREGCWVQSPTQGTDVPYPMTIANGAFVADGPVLNIKGGEFIQHYCPEPTTTAPPAPVTAAPAPVVAVTSTPAAVVATTTAPQSAGLPWWVIALALLALVGVGLGLAYACCGQEKEKRTKKASKRALNREPVVEPVVEPVQAAAPPAPPAPEPVFAQPAQVVTTTPTYHTVAQPVATSVVTAPVTYAAAPVSYAVEPTYAAAPAASTVVAPVTYAAAPVSYAVEPTYAAAPVASTVAAPATYAAAPVTYAAAPVTYAAPVAYASAPGSLVQAPMGSIAYASAPGSLVQASTGSVVPQEPVMFQG